MTSQEIDRIRRALTNVRGHDSGTVEGWLMEQLSAMGRLVSAEVALIQRYSRVGDVVAPRRHIWQAASQSGADAFRITEQLSILNPGTYHRAGVDVVSTPLCQRRSFLDDGAIWPRAVLEATDFYRKVYVPSGIAYQLRLMAFHERRFLGWVGFLRLAGSKPFQPADGRRLKPLVEPFVTAMAHADCLEKQQERAPADFVVDAAGRVEFMSAAGRGWLEQPGFRDALCARVQALDRGHPLVPPGPLTVSAARFLRLDGDDGRVRYLVHVAPPRDIWLSPLADLTGTERSVAHRAALGMTVGDVADELMISMETVRTHLKSVYRKLQVSNRSELCRAIDCQEG